MGVCLNIIKMTSITILSNIGPDFGKVVGKQEVIDMSFVLYVKNPLELNNMITEDYVSFETAKLLNAAMATIISQNISVITHLTSLIQSWKRIVALPRLFKWH